MTNATTDLEGDHDHESRHNGYPLVEESNVCTVAQTSVEDGGVVIEENNTLVRTDDEACGVRIATDGPDLWFEVGTRGHDLEEKIGDRRAYARGNMTPDQARMIAAALEEGADKVDQLRAEADEVADETTESDSLLSRLKTTVRGSDD